jgi:hypothetical protein
LIAGGIGLRTWSITALGALLPVPDQCPARAPGRYPEAYRYVHHPSHSGIALVLAGIAQACDDMLSLAAVAVLGEAWQYVSAPKTRS